MNIDKMTTEQLMGASYAMSYLITYMRFVGNDLLAEICKEHDRIGEEIERRNGNE